MIRPSPELIAVVRRWNKAVQTKDAPSLTNMLSSSEHLRYQGTAENESWAGPVFRKGFAAHAAEIPGFDWDEHSLEAFECGDIGWAHCLATLTFHGNANAALHRFTFVLHLEDGVWKMIQMHVSNPTSNLEKIGIEHAALNALVEAARQGFRQVQREGMASVMFTDIHGSSALAGRIGDQAWAHLIHTHLDLARNVIEAQGGTLVKSLGDGTMSSFSSAQAAVQAAIDLQTRNAARVQDPPLLIRIGIHTGEVIQTDDDFFGNVVNKSARIAAQTNPGEINISDSTRMLLGSQDDLPITQPRTATLKGLPGEHVVFGVTW